MRLTLALDCRASASVDGLESSGRITTGGDARQLLTPLIDLKWFLFDWWWDVGVENTFLLSCHTQFKDHTGVCACFSPFTTISQPAIFILSISRQASSNFVMVLKWTGMVRTSPRNVNPSQQPFFNLFDWVFWGILPLFDSESCRETGNAGYRAAIEPMPLQYGLNLNGMSYSTWANGVPCSAAFLKDLHLQMNNCILIWEASFSSKLQFRTITETTGCLQAWTNIESI